MAVELVASYQNRLTADYSAAFNSVDADYLVVCSTSAFNGGPISVSFNGVALTKIFSRIDTYNPSSGASIEFAIWTLQNPSQGSFTLALDANAVGADTYCFSVLALKGVNATTPVAGTDEGTHTAGGAFALTIETPYEGSFGILFGTVYSNLAGFDYHVVGTGFTELFDGQGVQTNSSAGQYLVYKVFDDAGEQELDNGHNNVDGSPTKSIEVAIILNGTSAPAAGSFFLVM